MTWTTHLDPAPPTCPHCHRRLLDVSLAYYAVKSFACDRCLVYLYIHPDGREEWAQQ